MDYTELAKEFMQNMHKFRSHKHGKNMNESIQGEKFIIMFLHERGGGVLPSEMSNALNVTSARIAAALNSLESKELVIRTMDKTDRRKILVDLTEKGRKIADENMNMAMEHTVQMLKKIGDKDAKEFVRIMGRIADEKDI